MTQQGIDTGQITKNARNSCTNITNIITFIFAAILNIAIYSLTTRSFLLLTIAGFLGGIYLMKLGFDISKPIQKQAISNANEQNKQQIQIVQKYSKVSIISSIVNFLVLITHYFLTFLMLFVILVLFTTLFKILSNYFLAQLYQIFYNNAQSQLIKQSISLAPQQNAFLYVALIYAFINNIIKQGHFKIGLQLFSYFSIYILIQVIAQLYVVFLMFVKLAIFMQIQKREEQECLNHGSNPNKKQRNALIHQGFKQCFKFFMNWKVISAYIRLNLRCIVILIFLWFLGPFLHICNGYFCRAVYQQKNYNQNIQTGINNSMKQEQKIKNQEYRKSLQQMMQKVKQLQQKQDNQTDRLNLKLIQDQYSQQLKQIQQKYKDLRKSNFNENLNMENEIFNLLNKIKQVQKKNQ